MPAPLHWHRFPALALLAGALTLAVGCNKKDEPTKAEGNGNPGEPKKDPPKPGDKKGGDITDADLRKAIKAAGGDPDKPVPPPKPRESLANVKPDFVLTAEEWDKLPRQQLNELWDKNKGKVFELTGIVDYASSGDIIGVMLKEGVDSRRIYIPTADEEPWKTVFPGQTIRLRTRAAVFSLWEIVEVKGPPPDKFSVEHFLAALAADKERAKEKYDGKRLILSGVIDKVEVFDSGHARVMLKSPGTEAMRCEFHPAFGREKERNKTLKAGMKLVLIGQYAFDGFIWCEVMELTRERVSPLR